MYGWQTKSWRNSTEKRQVDQERRELTEKHARGEVEFKAPADAFLLCHCMSFRYSHGLEAHKKLLSERDWRLPSERANMEIYEERFR